LFCSKECELSLQNVNVLHVHYLTLSLAYIFNNNVSTPPPFMYKPVIMVSIFWYWRLNDFKILAICFTCHYGHQALSLQHMHETCNDFLMIYYKSEKISSQSTCTLHIQNPKLYLLFKNPNSTLVENQSNGENVI